MRRTLADLLASRYDGGISIEPHLAVVHHDPSRRSPQAQRWSNYVEYGRRLERILTALGCAPPGSPG